MKRILILLCISCSLISSAQNRYVVYFTDKANNPYSINRPHEFLSQRSIERRAKNGFVTTEKDLPVTPDYIETISGLGADVYFTSRWLNAALTQMDPSLVSSIESLTMVDSVSLVASGSRLSRTKIPVDIGEEFTEPVEAEYTTDIQNSMLEIDVAHQRGFNGDGVLIAVCDSGFEDVNTTSPFRLLHDNNQIVGVKDFVTGSGNPYLEGIRQAHGTKVLSIMAATYAPAFNAASPSADYLLAVTEDGSSEDPIEEFNLLLGFEYADSAGADIINASVSYGIYWDEIPDYPAATFDGNTTTSSIAANHAGERGILVITSAGNDGPNRGILSPADSPYALAVGGVDANENKYSSSSPGPSADGRIKPDIAAMGENVTIFGRNADVQQNNGTSFASPLISGLTACIMHAFPNRTAAEIKQAIMLAGHLAGNPNNELGFGIPRFTKVESILNNTLGIKENHLLVYPTHFIGYINIKGDLSPYNQFLLIDLNGNSIMRGVIDELNNVHIETPSTLNPGVYHLILSGQKTAVMKVMKD